MNFLSLSYIAVKKPCVPVIKHPALKQQLQTFTYKEEILQDRNSHSFILFVLPPTEEISTLHYRPELWYYLELRSNRTPIR